MSAPFTIHIVRHGEVENPQEIFYARLPGFYLSKRGIGEVQAAGQALAQRPLAALFASPMERTQQSAQIIAQAHPQPLAVITDERLIEVYTHYEGYPKAELDRIQFDFYTGVQPPYERMSDLRRRAVDFVTEMRQRYAGQEVAAVTHGDILVTLLLYAMGKDADEVGRGRLHGWGLPEAYPATASILTLRFTNSAAAEIPAWTYQRPY